MGRLKKAGIVFLFSFVCTAQSNAQEKDIYDFDHSLQFVDYLFQTKQYALASREIERLLFLGKSDDNDSLKLLLLKSYRRSHQFQKAIERGMEIYDIPSSMPRSNAVELTTNLILQDSLTLARHFVNSSENLDTALKTKFLIHLAMLQKQWCEADHLYNTAPGHDYIYPYKGLINQALERPYRSPGLALGMSAVIPGSGKVYTGDWEDGMFTFLGVGAAAWQAYNGFSRKGSSSVYGWIFASLGGVVYISNIYGSFKSAKLFNKRHEDKIVKDTKPLLFHRDSGE